MATKRSTTKALKAKAVTKAQSEPGDGVSVVLGRQRNLIADLDEHEQSAESCKQKATTTMPPSCGNIRRCSGTASLWGVRSCPG